MKKQEKLEKAINLVLSRVDRLTENLEDDMHELLDEEASGWDIYFLDTYYTVLEGLLVGVDAEDTETRERIEHCFKIIEEAKKGYDNFWEAINNQN